MSFSGVSLAAFIDDEEEPFISVEHTGGVLSSGGEITLTLKVNQPTNAYFIGLEVAFDPNVFEYLVAEPGDEFESGMVIADLIGTNRIGVSVTRTDRTNKMWSGEALDVQFKVKERETDTNTSIQFLQLVLTDLYGTPLPSVTVSPIQLAITSEPIDPGDPGDDNEVPAPDPPDPVAPDFDLDFIDHDLIRYRFERTNLHPTTSTHDNRSSRFGLSEGSITFASHTGGANLVRSNGWNGKTFGGKYWSTAVNTSGFSGLLLTWQQWGSNSGPKNFRVEARIDEGEWTPVPDSDVELTANAAWHSVELPEWLENEPNIELRWVTTSEDRIDVNGGDIASTGTNSITNVRITGKADLEQILVYRPGDTNNDGVVDHTDVLPIGVYWLSGGPQADHSSVVFSDRTKQNWVPTEATYADANGDGFVNHLDLLPVGINYGLTSSPGKQLAKGTTLIEINESTVRELRFLISLSKSHHVRGVSGSIHLPSMDLADYRVRLEPLFTESLIMPEKGSSDLELTLNVSVATTVVDQILNTDNAVMSWYMPLSDGHAFAWVDRSLVYGVNEVTDLFEIVIEAHGSASSLSGSVVLSDISTVGVANSIIKTNDIVVKDLNFDNPEVPGTQTPEAFMLYPAYPNPFNPSTNIRWAMPESAEVRIMVADLLGRQVSVLADGHFAAGYHQVTFDARTLASGIYLVQIESHGFRQVRKVMLLK